MKTTSIWYVARPGEERRYSMPRAPTEATAAELRRQGFRIFRIDFQLPRDFDTSEESRDGTLEET